MDNGDKLLNFIVSVVGGLAAIGLAVVGAVVGLYKLANKIRGGGK